MNPDRDVEPLFDSPPPDTLDYDAWVLLANGAYWDHTDLKGVAEWNAARDRWRDRWHATLDVPDA
jgi:hypothetical protein